MKQLNIICKACGKILRSRTYRSETDQLTSIEVPACKVCLDKAKLEALFASQKEEG